MEYQGLVRLLKMGCRTFRRKRRDEAVQEVGVLRHLRCGLSDQHYHAAVPEWRMGQVLYNGETVIIYDTKK